MDYIALIRTSKEIIMEYGILQPTLCVIAIITAYRLPSILKEIRLLLKSKDEY